MLVNLKKLSEKLSNRVGETIEVKYISGSVGYIINSSKLLKKYDIKVIDAYLKKSPLTFCLDDRPYAWTHRRITQEVIDKGLLITHRTKELTQGVCFRLYTLITAERVFFGRLSDIPDDLPPECIIEHEGYIQFSTYYFETLKPIL